VVKLRRRDTARSRERFDDNMSVCPSICLSVCLSACLSVCLSVCHTPERSVRPRVRRLCDATLKVVTFSRSESGRMITALLPVVLVDELGSEDFSGL